MWFLVFFSIPIVEMYLLIEVAKRIVEFDEEDSLSEIYKRPWNDPQADTFTVKVRYRF